MEIIIVKDYEQMSQHAATLINQFVQDNPYATLGLATGHTPERTYKLLIEAHHDLHIDWTNITTFNLDEYIGLNPNSPHSYRAYMQEKLFKHLNIKPQNIHLPSITGDMAQNVINYEKSITNAGGINLQLLGIGQNGHIAFNEPGTDFETTTHVANLTPMTLSANNRYFKTPTDMPSKAITMGLKTIMQAQAIILLASGQDKATAVQQMIENEPSAKVPASILQNHNRVTVIVDQQAASKLKQVLR